MRYFIFFVVGMFIEMAIRPLNPADQFWIGLLVGAVAMGCGLLVELKYEKKYWFKNDKEA